MSTFDSISDFVKSGPKRFDDATELIEVPTSNAATSDARSRHLRGAMYLAGYGIECLVKGYLIELEGCQNLRQTQSVINSRRASRRIEPIRNIGASTAGHSIDYLMRLTDLSTRPGFDPKLWGRIAKWDTSWRYNPTPASIDEAHAFVSDVRKAINWLRPKILA